MPVVANGVSLKNKVIINRVDPVKTARYKG